VFDASAKLPPGVLKGKLQWLGSYEECRSIPVGFAHYCPVAIGSQPSLQVDIFMVFTFLWNVYY